MGKLDVKRSVLIAEAKRLKQENLLREELPHQFRINPYKWMNEYWSSTNRMKFICAGNQVGKSSSQIIHCIVLATDKTKWTPEAGYFPRREPQVFWYIYPSKGKVQEEFREKWEAEFLPKGSMKKHPVFGWEKFNVDGEFAGIRFNTGVAIYFKSWGMDLQAGTVDAVFADEELPADKYPELQMRVSAHNGMFSMVFTATLNQPFWYDVIEKRGRRGEKFPDAAKWQISMERDCRYFADGTPSHFTPEEVNKRKNSIGDPAEIDRRIHGRFVTSVGRKYKTFNRDRNVKPRQRLDASQFDFYGGVDIGTGGEGHPAAIAIVAVRRDMRYGKLIRFWIGNDQENTTTTDILNKYVELTEDLTMSGAYYDWHSKEFHLRAMAAGIPFSKAEKGHDVGEDLLSVLFKNQMLDIEEGRTHQEQEMIERLCSQFETLKAETPKKDADDDGIDGLRYAVTKLPWDLNHITTTLIELDETRKDLSESEQRAANGERMVKPRDDSEEWSYERDVDMYNELQMIAGDYYGEDF